MGVNSYILKPLNVSKLTEAVGQIACYWLELNRPAPSQSDLRACARKF